MLRRVSWPLWVVPAAVLISGCAPQAPPRTPQRAARQHRHAARRSRRRGIAPALDRLAAAGVQFANARTTVPLTLPAHASLLTGALPAAHGVHVNGQVLPADVPTLATVLRAAGYRTGGFVGAYVLDRRFGLARGFDTYDDRVQRDPRGRDRLEAERRGDQVVDAALAWLGMPLTSDAVLPVGAPLRSARAVRSAAGVPRMGRRGPYDGEVRIRRRAGRAAVQRIDARGLLDRTTIVVSPAITAKDWANTARRPTGCSPTTRRCGCRWWSARQARAARHIAAPGVARRCRARRCCDSRA